RFCEPCKTSKPCGKEEIQDGGGTGLCATQGLTLPQPISAGPNTKGPDTLRAIFDSFWAMLLNRARRAADIRELDKGDRARNEEWPWKPPTSRQIPRTNPTTLKQRKLRKLHYRLRHAGQTGKPGGHRRKTEGREELGPCLYNPPLHGTL
ncbi:Hypothetical predicted protein, partial [Pelobates cultripes]